jgi:hypothetical protein
MTERSNYGFKVMKDPCKFLIIAVVCITLGGVLLVVGSSMSIPPEYSTFLGIPHGVNPAYASSFHEMIFLIMAGTLFLGLGIGVGVMGSYVARLERKITQIPQSPKAFCRYCGTQTTPDSNFCTKCGNKLT